MTELVRDVFSGIVGATFCTYIGFPFDYIKARLQNGQGKTMLSAINQTRLQPSGLLGFFKGVSPALASAIVENSVL